MEELTLGASFRLLVAGSIDRWVAVLEAKVKDEGKRKQSTNEAGSRCKSRGLRGWLIGRQRLGEEKLQREG